MAYRAKAASAKSRQKVARPMTFRRALEIEIDKTSEFVRAGHRDNLSDQAKEAFDSMQLRMGLLLSSVVEFENAQK
jgi:hypothetical protein